MSSSPSRDWPGSALDGVDWLCLDTAYLERRSNLMDGVTRTLRLECGHGSKLMGSWRRQDFHLSMASGKSYSDIDVYDPNRRSHAEVRWDLDGGVHQLRFRVSIHPYNYEDNLSNAGQRLIALLNLASSVTQPDETRLYVEAKSYLRLSGAGLGIAALGAVVSDAAAEAQRAALEVKIGTRKPEELASNNGFRTELVMAVARARSEFGLPSSDDLAVDELVGVVSQQIAAVDNSMFRDYLIRKYSPSYQDSQA